VIFLSTLMLFAGQPASSCDSAAFRTKQTTERARLIEETRKLVAESKEIGERRFALARRRVELGEMSPAKRALKGTFDPKYNDVSLRADDKLLTDRLELISQRAHHQS
jgi:hypothetical protein